MPGCQAAQQDIITAIPTPPSSAMRAKVYSPHRHHLLLQQAQESGQQGPQGRTLGAGELQHEAAS